MREGNVVVKAGQLQIEVRRRSCVVTGLFRYELLHFLEIDARETSTEIAVSKKTETIWNCATHAVVVVAHTDCDCYNRHGET